MRSNKIEIKRCPIHDAMLTMDGFCYECFAEKHPKDNPREKYREKRSKGGLKKCPGHKSQSYLPDGQCNICGGWKKI